jgi:hypothetical protein
VEEVWSLEFGVWSLPARKLLSDGEFVQNKNAIPKTINIYGHFRMLRVIFIFLAGYL